MKKCCLISCSLLLLLSGCTASMRFTSLLSGTRVGLVSSIPLSNQSIRYSRKLTNDNGSSNETASDTTFHSFRGLASYYGNEFNGRMTSNGEIFDPNRFTAAHRSLPFGTFLLVTNLKNDASVVVRINDRGPFKMERVLDLSQAAAEELDMLRVGVQEVSVRIIE